MVDINIARPYVCCNGTTKGNKSCNKLRSAAAEPCNKLIGHYKGHKYGGTFKTLNSGKISVNRSWPLAKFKQ